ncbi:hypothetical protein [Bradyrhizobium sp. CB3481]|uniref:hypothetical protein n=1 Tax=Bradyrhizobium sp. CB3481 TaxID=3039158 RepID=UPI0024B0D35C|nr:hypothetical protein [Bradyrhizobium sp. CB3481]WFU14915.1 hypothetical protein QA643_28525 [Bradyrhizobium sp. CB3481]
MSVTAPGNRSVALATVATAPVLIEDGARFSRALERATLDGCEAFEEGPGCKSLGNDQRDLEESGSAASSPLLAVSPVRAMLAPVEHPSAAQGQSRSVELAELAEVILARFSINGDYEGDTSVHIVLKGALFGDARVSVSCRDDTVNVCIDSERLWPILQLGGHAFARELSDRLGMRAIIAAVSHNSSSEEQDSNLAITRVRPILHYEAEKSS